MKPIRLKTWSGTLCLGLALTAGAQTPDPLAPWLPPAERVRQVLEATPALQAAQSSQSAQLQRARGIEAGPAEFSVRLNQQSRRVQDTPDRFSETMVSLERPVRLWGKARLDGELAEQGRKVARIAYADALHEASRELIRHWFAALRSVLEGEGAAYDLTLAQELHRQAQVRLRQGDISQLDGSLAEAELQRVQAAQALAQAQRAAAAAQLQRVYPGLPAPSLPQDGAVPALAELAPLLRSFLQNHHELNLARAEAERLRLLAERVDKERLPDPTIGLFSARERGGAESIVGVSLGFALPGEARRSQAVAAHYEALSAQDKVRQLEQQLAAAFEARWLRLHHQRQATRGLQAAAQTQALAAEKSAKAYALGEHGMTELIHNRRLAQEQRLASERLRLDMAEGWALMQLDLHAIWDFD